MNKVEMGRKKRMSRSVDILLWLFAMGFAACIPLTGVVTDYIPKASVFSLGFLGLFTIAWLCETLCHRRLWEYIRKDFLLFAMVTVAMVITTVKYVLDILNGCQSGFFAYYAIPAYMAGTFCVGCWLAEKRSRMYELMQAYGVVFCIAFLICSDRYIMDVGGVVRAVGNYSNPNEMSVYAFCALAFCTALIYERQYSTIINLFISATSMSALILGQSRTAIGAVGIAAVVAVLVALLEERTSQTRRWSKSIIVRCGVLVITFAAMTALLYQILTPNLLTVTDIRGEFYTYTGRVELIRAYPELREPLGDILNKSEPPSAQGDIVNKSEPPSAQGDIVNKSEPPSAQGDIPNKSEPPSAQEDFFCNPGELGQFQESGHTQTGNSGETSHASAFKSILRRLLDGNGTDSSSVLNNLRFKIWRSYLMNAEEYWLFGAENGFASVSPVFDGTARACHNTFLFVFVQYGLIVLALLVMVVSRRIKNLVLIRKGNHRKVPYACMLAGLLFFMMLNDLVNVAAFWLMLAILSSVAYNMDCGKTRSVAIVRRYSGFGGIEHQIVNICKGLSAQGVQVHLVTDQTSVLTEKAQQAGAVVAIRSLSNPLVAGLMLAQYCRENQVDILQTHMFFESMAGRVARFVYGGIKHIYRVHTYIECSHISKTKKKLYHALSFVTDAWVDLYLPINEYNRQEMRKLSLLPEHKIKIVHDGVREPGEPFEQQPVCNNKIAMIANFVAFKGHDILIEGLDVLRSRGIVLQAYLYGGCPRDRAGIEDTSVLNEIQQEVNSRGLQEQVHFCGFTTDVRKSLEGMWALVLPSYAEGTPNCVLEAMSLRVLAVCSNVGGVPEFVTNGSTGFCHEPKNPYAFADAVEQAIKASEEQSRQILDNAFKIWKDEYSVPAMLCGLEASYEALLSQ